MSEETIAVWREALTNRNHELYKAAWTVFTQGINLTVAAERLNEQKEQIIPFLLEIIDDSYLAAKEAPGDGVAPYNAVSLLGEWKVREALPKFLDILENNTSRQPIYRAAITAISTLGADVIDEVLAWVENDSDLHSEAADILAKIGDERGFDPILSWIEPGDYNHETYIQHLIQLNPERAAAELRRLNQAREFSREERDFFKTKLKEAKNAVRALKNVEETKAEEAVVETPEA